VAAPGAMTLDAIARAGDLRRIRARASNLDKASDGTVSVATGRGSLTAS
jgi:hypothetical protein